VAEIQYTTDGSDPNGPGANSCDANPCSFTVSASTTVLYRSVDVAGNVEATKSQAIQIDTQPPSVAITSPTDLSAVRGTVTVRASARDNVSIAAVRFYADGRHIGTSRSAPYQVLWNSSSYGVGLHYLHATAVDLAGNSARSTRIRVAVIP
jgi:hypothetical protein